MYFQKIKEIIMNNSMYMIIFLVIIYIIAISLIMLLFTYWSYGSDFINYKSIKWGLIDIEFAKNIIPTSLVAFISFLGIIYTNIENNKRHKVELETAEKRFTSETNNQKKYNEKMLIMLSNYSDHQKALIMFLEILGKYIDLIKNYKDKYEILKESDDLVQNLNNELCSDYSKLDIEIQSFQDSFLFPSIGDSEWIFYFKELNNRYKKKIYEGADSTINICPENPWDKDYIELNSFFRQCRKRLYKCAN